MCSSSLGIVHSIIVSKYLGPRSQSSPPVRLSESHELTHSTGFVSGTCKTFERLLRAKFLKDGINVYHHPSGVG